MKLANVRPASGTSHRSLDRFRSRLPPLPPFARTVSCHRRKSHLETFSRMAPIRRSSNATHTHMSARCLNPTGNPLPARRAQARP